MFLRFWRKTSCDMRHCTISCVGKESVHILILLIITLGIGLYLILTTTIVAKDGVTFIEYAKNLEIDANQTMLKQGQPPGYPAMILTAHKIAELFIKDDSVFVWIYSAQSITMMFRLLTVAILYLIGKNLVGTKISFLAVLILVFLPKPAEYGSDALSDWPHLFFLALGMLMLIYASAGKKWYLYGFCGLAAGAGYLVRPECIQIVIYGMLWLVLQFFGTRHLLSKSKAILAMLLLLICFCILACPYMKLKGAIFPKKDLFRLQSGVVLPASYTAAFVPSNAAKASQKLFENIGETLMWFFVPALFIGLYKNFKKPKWYEPQHFFIAVLIFLNIVLMAALYCNAGYMSARHTLPLVVFTVFYIPSGMRVLGELLSKLCFRRGDANLGFIILTTIGIAICIPKLLRPLHQDKLIYRKAAQWLIENTKPNDIIAVPDIRISFYSDRIGVDYKHNAFPQNPQYIVVASNKKELTEDMTLQPLCEPLFTELSTDKYKINIYRLSAE